MSDTKFFRRIPGAFDRARDAAKRTCFTPFVQHSSLIARTASLSHFSTTDEDINLETRPAPAL
jgi:triphosphoribosyl-dephospho-CoA synthetase